MRALCLAWAVTGLAAATLACLADDPTPATDLERLATSRAIWEKARDAAGGDYSYEVLQITLVSRQTTRIVVKQGKVVERSFEQATSLPQAAEPGRPAAGSKPGWTETGAEIGTHDGAAPPHTVDELYDKAAKLLATPPGEFRARSLGIEKRGFLHHCFERDSRIADDAPLDGVMPFEITLGTR